MTFEEMIPEIEKAGINLYGMAFYRDGNIVEQGNHESLLKANGFYAELYNSQFAEN